MNRTCFVFKSLERSLAVQVLSTKLGRLNEILQTLLQALHHASCLHRWKLIVSCHSHAGHRDIGLSKLQFWQGGLFENGDFDTSRKSSQWYQWYLYWYLISKRMLIRFGQRQRCENTPLWPQYLIALSGLVVLAGNLNLISVLGSLCRSTTSGMRGLSHFGSVRLPRPATGPSESGMALDSPACIQVFQVLPKFHYLWLKILDLGTLVPFRIFKTARVLWLRCGAR